MTVIVLIRGVPGSGKTTKAKAEYPDHELIEADQFFMSGGEYCYDGSKIKEAHERMLARQTLVPNVKAQPTAKASEASCSGSAGAKS